MSKERAVSRRLADPTASVVTDGSAEAERDIQQARVQAARALASGDADRANRLFERGTEEVGLSAESAQERT